MKFVQPDEPLLTPDQTLLTGAAEGYPQLSASNSLGTFVYNSLGDFQANTPASFSRTLFTPDNRRRSIRRVRGR